MLIDAQDGEPPARPAADGTSASAAGAALQARVSPAAYQLADRPADQSGPLNAELQNLNDQEYELAQLEREVRLLEGKYEMHVRKLEEARVNDALGQERITNVKVAQPATLVYKPVAPNKLLVAAGALLVALVASIGSAFAAEKMDQSLQTTDQVEKELGLPVLTSLPYRKRKRNGQTSSKASANGVVAANGKVSENGAHRSGSYRGLLATLCSGAIREKGRARTIGVVGCDNATLRSRVAANLAMDAASGGQDRVLLIDADARHQRIAKHFQVNDLPGWREVLSGNAALESAVQQSSSDNLAVMGPGGSNGHVPAADLSADSIGQLERIKSDYGLVVVDLPPVPELDGPPVPMDWLDEAVLVVDSEQTRIQAAQRIMDMLTRAGVPVSGVVLANRREYIPRWLYQRL
jgi:tyrosine-protein kinase Etk/Wzc